MKNLNLLFTKFFILSVLLVIPAFTLKADNLSKQLEGTFATLIKTNDEKNLLEFTFNTDGTFEYKSTYIVMFNQNECSILTMGVGTWNFLPNDNQKVSLQVFGIDKFPFYTKDKYFENTKQYSKSKDDQISYLQLLLKDFKIIDISTKFMDTNILYTKINIHWIRTID